MRPRTTMSSMTSSNGTSTSTGSRSAHDVARNACCSACRSASGATSASPEPGTSSRSSKPRRREPLLEPQMERGAAARERRRRGRQRSAQLARELVGVASQRDELADRQLPRQLDVEPGALACAPRVRRAAPRRRDSTRRVAVVRAIAPSSVPELGGHRLDERGRGLDGRTPRGQRVERPGRRVGPSSCIGFGVPSGGSSVQQSTSPRPVSHTSCTASRNTLASRGFWVSSHR